MPLRMAEYCWSILRLFGKFPRQIVLYVGEVPLAMDNELLSPDVSFRYRIVDIRDLDGDRLLESQETGDNVIAILARLRDHEAAIRTIVARLIGLPEAERKAALSQLIMLAGLRHLGKTLETEIRKMPVYIDILENEILGPAFKRGLEEGELKGKLEGKLEILRRLIEKRFGPIPEWAHERLAARSAAELEEVSVRILDVASVEDLLR